MKIGIVGMGRFGLFHLEKYKNIPNVEEIHFYDPIVRDISDVTQDFTLESMAESVDAVSITAPSNLHYGIGSYFLSKGVHCLIEKPLATTLRDARQLVNTAETSGAYLQVGHIERFNDSYLEHKDEINDLLFVNSSRYCMYTGRCRDIDVVLDLMIHDIDILLQHVDSPIASLQVRGTGFRDRQSADVVYCSIEFENHVCANLTAHRWSNLNIRRTIFCGKNRSVEVDFNESKDSLHTEVESFVNCILGKECVQVTGKDGVEALALALKIKEKLYDDSCELCWID